MLFAIFVVVGRVVGRVVKGSCVFLGMWGGGRGEG